MLFRVNGPLYVWVVLPCVQCMAWRGSAPFSPHRPVKLLLLPASCIGRGQQPSPSRSFYLCCCWGGERRGRRRGGGVGLFDVPVLLHLRLLLLVVLCDAGCSVDELTACGRISCRRRFNRVRSVVGTYGRLALYKWAAVACTYWRHEQEYRIARSGSYKVNDPFRGTASLLNGHSNTWTCIEELSFSSGPCFRGECNINISDLYMMRIVHMCLFTLFLWRPGLMSNWYWVIILRLRNMICVVMLVCCGGGWRVSLQMAIDADSSGDR